MLCASLACGSASDAVPEETVALATMDSAAAARLAGAIIDSVPVDAFAAESLHVAGLVLPFRLLEPRNTRAGTRSPLVLVMHGSGAIGTDNVSQLGAFARAWALPSIRERFPAFIAVPQSADRTAIYSGSDSLQSSDGTVWLDAVLSLVDTLVRTKAIDPSRVYVTGFSMGGSAVWNAVLKRPDLFAAAVPISGIPPARGKAGSLRSIPLWIVHGDADTENPIVADRAMFRALVGDGADIRFRVYRGLDHRIAPEFLADTTWRAWLFAHHRGVSAR